MFIKIIVILFAVYSCTANQNNKHPKDILMSPVQIKPIVGVWIKSSSESSEHNYPDKLFFKENGLFQAIDKPESTFYIWDVGTYEFKGKTKILISCANDKIVAYGIKFSKNKQVMTITDEQKCKVQYHKSE
ncbi:MAG: hypothetical protein IPN49_15050 [Saprospiraceae bacterium]|nr:hypothetical protein [Saprospiraceae bacterium]MBK8853228.1 hypothetical protein [Saprospiraceae bacterium]